MLEGPRKAVRDVSIPPATAQSLALAAVSLSNRHPHAPRPALDAPPPAQAGPPTTPASAKAVGLRTWPLLNAATRRPCPRGPAAMAVWGAPAKLLIRPLRPRAPVTLGIRVPQSKAKRRHGRAAPRGVLHLQEGDVCQTPQYGRRPVSLHRVLVSFVLLQRVLCHRRVMLQHGTKPKVRCLWDPGRSKSDIFEHTLTDTGGVRSCCPSQVQWCVPVWCVCVCVCVCVCPPWVYWSLVLGFPHEEGVCPPGGAFRYAAQVTNELERTD